MLRVTFHVHTTILMVVFHGLWQ